MKMTFTYRCEGALGIVELAGKKDFYAAVKAWEKIRLKIISDRLSGVLIIDKSVSNLTAFQVVDVQGWMAKNNFPKDIKVAIFDEQAKNRENNNLFGETVVYNRGWVNIRAFSHEDAARGWLDLTENQIFHQL